MPRFPQITIDQSGHVTFRPAVPLLFDCAEVAPASTPEFDLPDPEDNKCALPTS